MMKRLNLITGVLSAIVAAWAAIKMSQQQFWLHLPLVLFLGAWISFMLLIDNFWIKNPQTKKHFFLSALSGILLSVGFPPYDLTPLLFVGFVPLFYIQQECNQNKTSSFWYIYNAFVLWNIYVTYWVANAALIPGIVAIWLNSLFMLVPWYLSEFVSRKTPILKGVAFICFWCSFEFLHLHWEISWPWLNLGNAWSALPSWIQWYEYTGTFGGTIWILILNVVIFNLFFNKFQIGFSSFYKIFNSPTKKFLLVSLLIFIPLCISLLRYSNYLPTGKYGEVCVVQPNYEPHYEKFTVPEMDQITRLGRLAETACNENTKFIVFPETCFGDSGGPIRSDKVSSDNRIILFYDFVESHFNIPIVMGLTTVTFLNELSESKFKRTNPRTKQSYEIANSSVILKDRMETVKVYNKSKLVPGAEIFPYRDYLPFLLPLVNKLGGSTAGLATQSVRNVFESQGYKIAPIICYESIYGDYMRGFANNGAGAIFVMTNDGWWDDTPGYKQHMAYSKLRAIELRKPVVRSANTGISCFINSKGEVTKQTEYGVMASITDSVSFSDETTFYTKYGDFIAYIALIISALIIFFSIGKRFF
ncbi:MAG: apolipoprotein N-acyltransferase [Saprospiraceae bacterium]|nr:apolipoprotein N-acyltransferase [Saprospiraceae bacterium]